MGAFSAPSQIACRASESGTCPACITRSPLNFTCASVAAVMLRIHRCDASMTVMGDTATDESELNLCCHSVDFSTGEQEHAPSHEMSATPAFLGVSALARMPGLERDT